MTGEEMLLETQRLSPFTDIFTERAEAYQRAMETNPTARDKEFLNVLHYADIQDGHVVFDIPSYGGYLLPHTPVNAKVIGLDPSGAFAELERKTEQQVVRCEEIEFPYRDCTADRVVSISGAHLMGDRLAFFKEVKRVMKLGGILSVADVHIESKVAHFLQRFVNANSSKGYQGKFVDDNTQRLIEGSGLVVTFAQRISFPWKFSSIDGAIEFVRQLFGIDMASPKDIEAALQDYLGIQKIGKEYYLRWELMFYKATRVRL
ncbi:MAG: methyltransferase domain-containing protein [Alphaproteobacteria bacterium]|nr:methyltransferase domain-containing protein [Alphaproteobacteria bacterium]